MIRIGLILVTVMSLFNFSFGQSSKEQAFWKWFKTNEARLFEFEKDQDKIFAALAEEMHKINAGLTFEFGPNNDGVREFVISADGNKAMFPFVISLADKAPSMPKWKIIRFRPRREPMREFTFEGKRLLSGQIRFTIESDGDKAGITLFMEGYEPSQHNTFGSIGFLYLDNCLGEYDVETKVGFVQFKNAEEPSKLTKRPLSELAATFDKFTKPNLN